MGKQVTPAPRDRAWRKDYGFPSRSSTVRHVSTPMSPWGYFCPPTPLTTPLKHETPPATFEHCPAGLVVKISLYEMHGHPMRHAILLWKWCHCSQRCQTHHNLCCAHGFHQLPVVPTAAAPGLLDRLVQARWPWSDPPVQMLQCSHYFALPEQKVKVWQH